MAHSVTQLSSRKEIEGDDLAICVSQRQVTLVVKRRGDLIAELGRFDYNPCCSDEAEY